MNNQCCKKGHKNKHIDPCAPKCDPCSKQERILYCGRDIECLGIEKGDDLKKVLETFGDTICQIKEELSTNTHIVVTSVAPGSTCTFGGVRINVVEDLTGNIISSNTLCNGGEGGGVESVTGNVVDNTDPLNPVVNVPELVLEITYEEGQDLIEGNDVSVGSTYFVSDRGIYLTGVEDNLFSTTGERIMRVIRNTYYTSTTGVKGVWNNTINPDTNDVVIWGGKVWRSLTGNVGTATNDTVLDNINWAAIPTSNNTYYYTKSFGCTFDWINDWVSKQWDERGNVFSFDWYLNVFGNNYPYNLINISDWGNEKIFNNEVFAIYNNSNGNSIYNNSNIGGIFRNTNTYEIFSNTNKGDISDNSCGGSVFLNSNSGNIRTNSNNGSINRNSNEGNILGNSNSGTISFNSNFGSILSNSNDGSIVSNQNSGSIEENNNTDRINRNSNLGSISNNTNLGEIATNFNAGSIESNSNFDVITSNSNNGSIENNSNNGSVSNNSNGGGISNNSNIGQINFNTNAGSVYDNTNSGVISSNSNSGNIYENSNSARISFNSNNGEIATINSANSNIEFNINNGDIVTTTTGDISDTVVNK